MTATTDLTPDQQHALVYQGIVAVAQRCDGAVDEDGVGFNGQDTKFGRRIASVTFEEWTPEIKDEAASIIIKYRKQVEAYTGIDVATLDVVNEARGSGVARDQARQIEKKAAALAKRHARVDGPIVRLSFPYDSDLVAAVRRLPERQWNAASKEWVVAHSAELAAFVAEHGFQVHGEINVPDPAETEPATPVEAKPAVTLEGNRVRIAFDYDPILVAEVRNLPGRQYDGSTKTNTADLHVEVLAFADRHGLKVADDVRDALAGQEAEISAEQAEADLRKLVSGLANPADLPEEFVARVLAATSKAKVV